MIIKCINIENLNPVFFIFIEIKLTKKLLTYLLIKYYVFQTGNKLTFDLLKEQKT